MECFTASLALLNLWLACVLWQSYTHGLHFPKTGLTLSLTLFWLWLGLSLVWHPAPLIGINYFWIVGSLPLVFWIYTLSQDQNRLWHFLSRAALLTGVVLAVWALYRVFVQHDIARSVFLDINSHAAFLNLIVLPAAAYFLLQRPSVRSAKIMGALLFLLLFALALTKGRGALLSFALGLGLLVWMAWGHAPRRNIWALLMLVAGAYLLANVTWGEEGGGGRLQAVLFNPASAGADRYIIWQQAWEMLKSASWLGTGIGTFWLAWPPWRDPADESGGYYVHNDYLQLWIETGLPGILLLLAVLGTALWLFVRVIKNARTTSETRVEITGLLAGLFAIAAHSFFNFNFYVLPTLILAGVVLGRFHQLAAGVLGAGQLRLHPATWVGKRAYSTLVVLLALFPLSYFATQAASDYYYQRALRLSTEGKLEAVGDALSRAARLSPLADNVLNTYADLFRHLLAALPEAAREDRKLLYAASLELLAKAQRLNALRAQIFLTRGQLYHQNPGLAGERWFDLASTEYQTALTLDPRFYKARAAYAQLLLSRGKTPEAKQLLEDGMRYWYFGTPDILQYYELTRRARQQAGETAQARRIETRVEGILERFNMRRVVVPAATAPQISGPAAKSGVSLN
ncbi:MAG: O-antigen ligase family protein [Gammaproteobacteria bacterium]|nr:O-antigen ligase family protein [Gammaproteobacteria bacterium]